MSRRPLWLRFAIFFTFALVSAVAAAQQAQQVIIPDPDIGERTLPQRQRAQLATADSLGARHDFTYTDRLPETGITFRHRIVEDAAKNYKAAHYDHGNGLLVADVDGDGLLDLYWASQAGGNELWRNLGDNRFENFTEEAGVGLPGRTHVTGAFGDIDNDGDPDLFATTVRGGNALFENDGSGHFTDISAAAGVDYVGHSSGAVFFDYDGDGLLDLFVTNVGEYTIDEQGPGGFWRAHEDAFSGHLMPERTEYSILYHNEGDNRFRDVSREIGLVDGSWSGDAALVDFNRDSFPDLYVLDMQGDDHYYENQQGRAFAERTASLFPVTPWGAMGVEIFDYDNDGRLDMLVTDMHSDMSANVPPADEDVKPVIPNAERFFQDPANNVLGNAFFHQLEDGTFEEISDAVGLENYWPWGTSAGDVNADGWPDVFISSSMNYPFRYGINALRLNVHGQKFAPAEFILGVEPRRNNKIRDVWFELDCSGADADHPRCQGRSGRVQIMGAVGSRTSVLVDIDDDGDLDLITGEFNTEPQFLVSDLADNHEIHWLKVSPVGTFSNRDALGARVTVCAGDLCQVQMVDGKSGYLSQSSMPLYFGLGDASVVDRVTIVWPSGAEQTVDGPLDANQTLRVEEE